MKSSSLSILAAAATLVVTAIATGAAQQPHTHGQHTPGHSEQIAPRSALQPAEGASVKIIVPKDGQVIEGDTVPLQFTLVKGKRGAHVHAYVDGELAGMFQSDKGTLTGIKPGPHTLELRVATSNHQTELAATDKVSFRTK